MKIEKFISIAKTLIKNREPILLQSAPGNGKTDVVSQITKDLGMRLMITHPVVDDPTDYKGLPYASANGEADFLPFGNLRDILNSVNPMVVLMDDIGNATPAVQASVMQMVLAREINGKKIPDCVSFVACTNRRKDATGVNGIIKALVSRFTLVCELEPEVVSWQKWASANKMPMPLITFLKWRPQLLNNFDPSNKEIENFACPRTIASLGRMINMGIIDLEAWTGAVGQAFATEFIGYYELFTKLGNVPNEIAMRGKNCTFIPDSDRLDIKHALIGALYNITSEKNIENVMDYICNSGHIETEFQAAYISYIGNKPELQKTESYIRWCAANGDVIS